MQLMFGSGYLYGFRTDVSNPTPIQFGAFQEVGLDFAFTVKELMGQYQFPIDVARAGGKITGKAKNARLQARQLNDLFFNQTLVVGQKVSIIAEGPTAIPATPFQITVAQGATFVEDLGVVNSSTGIPFVRVAAAPTAGQYTVSAGGVYLFASADNVSAIAVLINYTYTIAGAGQKFTIANKTMGDAPIWKAVLFGTYRSLKVQVELNACIATKLTMATKLEDYMIPEFDFSAFADASNNLGAVSIQETS